MGTTKGYTGQYTDPTSELDYYVARYYDPVAGIFLSADTKEGNAQGMNPYAYVAQNPETLTDPTGQYFAPPGGNGNGDPDPPSCEQLNDCGKVHIDYPTPSPTHAKTVKVPQCDTQCQNEKAARQQAINAAAFFSGLANDLTDLENMLNMTDLENLLSLKSLFGKYGQDVMGYVNLALGGVAVVASPQYAGLLIALPRYRRGSEFSWGWPGCFHRRDRCANWRQPDTCRRYGSGYYCGWYIYNGIHCSQLSGRAK